MTAVISGAYCVQLLVKIGVSHLNPLVRETVSRPPMLRSSPCGSSTNNNDHKHAWSNQYRVGWPLDFLTTIMRLGIESIKRAHRSAGMRGHSNCTRAHSSSTLLNLRRARRRLSRSRKFSIGLQSGLCAEQSIVKISVSSRCKRVCSSSGRASLPTCAHA